MEMRRKNRKGKIVEWLREDFFVSGPAIFYDNIPKMAKAFGEHLTPSQLTDVILKALEVVTNSNKNISQAAGLLLNSFMKECGMEMEELPMILREMYVCLPNILDPSTKEDIIIAVCHLASKRANRVVDTILEVLVECDGTARELWRALVADPYASLRIMKPLLKRLQDEDPSTETTRKRNCKSVMPIAATNALSFILSLPEAAEVIENKFPPLLIALVTQIYFLLGASKRGSRRSSLLNDWHRFLSLCPFSTAVQAIRNLIVCAGYLREFEALGLLGCWEMLLSPDGLFQAISHLARNLFAFSKVELKDMFIQASAYLHRPDIREKTIGMIFFSELLYHPEVGHHFTMRHILDALHKWMSQSYILLQIFSIRGLGYLLQHPLETKVLRPMLGPVVNCAMQHHSSLAKEALRTLKILFGQLDVRIYGYKAAVLIPHLLQYFWDEDTELRNNSISIFGILLRGVNLIENNNITVNIMQSLVPLLIQLSDGQTKEVSRNALNACIAFMEWEDVPSNLFNHQMYSSPHSMYKDICAVIVSWPLCENKESYKSSLASFLPSFPQMNKCKQNISKMLDQMLDFLGNRKALYRKAAAQLIVHQHFLFICLACCALYLTPDVVPSRQLEGVYLALRDLEGDCEPSVARVAAASLEELFRQCGHRINPDLVSSQLLAKVIGSISIQPSEAQQ
ncbi:maestro heat-like repeat-containing protein family member 6 [Pseudonaja textilis]|uniref:maestro heat-like repeat-containing protein family member 6 n=1 Tax=Pseudonaja textilis TaxID=8673 RepID=UPI000EA9A656|nr:maestro heat-like repeat-containing protein family member 6 [Pseudonaja textilis]